METKNNKSTKPNYTEKDVLIAVSKMEAEDRVWLETHTVKALVELVKNKEFRETTLKNLDWYIENMPKYKKAVINMCTLALNEKLHSTTDNKMADMIENYKGFSREERFKFYKKLEKEKTPVNIADETKDMWSNFADKFWKVLEML